MEDYSPIKKNKRYIQKVISKEYALCILFYYD